MRCLGGQHHADRALLVAHQEGECVVGEQVRDVPGLVLHLALLPPIELQVPAQVRVIVDVPGLQPDELVEALEHGIELSAVAQMPLAE